MSGFVHLVLIKIIQCHTFLSRNVFQSFGQSFVSQFWHSDFRTIKLTNYHYLEQRREVWNWNQVTNSYQSYINSESHLIALVWLCLSSCLFAPSSISISSFTKFSVWCCQTYYEQLQIGRLGFSDSSYLLTCWSDTPQENVFHWNLRLAWFCVKKLAWSCKVYCDATLLSTAFNTISWAPHSSSFSLWIITATETSWAIFTRFRIFLWPVRLQFFVKKSVI